MEPFRAEAGFQVSLDASERSLWYVAGVDRHHRFSLCASPDLVAALLADHLAAEATKRSGELPSDHGSVSTVLNAVSSMEVDTEYNVPSVGTHPRRNAGMCARLMRP